MRRRKKKKKTTATGGMCGDRRKIDSTVVFVQQIETFVCRP